MINPQPSFGQYNCLGSLSSSISPTRTMALNISNSKSSDLSPRNDGRIRCLPRKKNEPYICSKCNSELATPQKFAAHVSSAHYKYETKTEKKQRVMAKFRGKTRDLRLVKVKEGLTVVPHDYSGEFVSPFGDGAGSSSNSRSPVMVKVESVEVGEGVRCVKYALAPPPGIEFNPDAGLKIKVERDEI